MIGSTRRVSVYACTEPTDMRKGHDGLSAIVRESLSRDPLSGELFLFLSRNRKRAKVLLWDGTGLCVYAKRLERNRFSNLTRNEDGALRLTMNELQLFLEGSHLVGKVEVSPPPYERDCLARM
ncbi:MAG: IS66 family insertion sequence element accessory protein TnpB [Candidatus Krumholzibacteriia bacterium]